MTDVRSLELFKQWVRSSREEALRNPTRYISYYGNKIACDDEYAWMTHDIFDLLLFHCGRYDFSFPTGKYCGKLFVRGPYLMWYGINTKDLRTCVTVKHRKIRFIDE